MLGINLIRNIHVHKKKNTYNPQKHEEEDLDKQKCILFLSRKIQNYSTVSSSKMYWKIQSNLNQNSSVIIFGVCQHCSKFYLEEHIGENRSLRQN